MITKRILQYIAALAASTATISSGLVFAWPAQISDKLLDGVLGFPINTDELGWICAFSSIGSAICTLVVGPVCDAIGRKVTMLLLIIIFEIGWVPIIFANNTWLLIVGRFFTGMGAGAYCVTVSMYIGEIVDKDVRGTLGTLTQFMICIGVLIAIVLGAYLPVRHFFVACGIMPLVFGLVFFSMPETPVYYLLKGKEDPARSSLKRLTGKEDVGEEMNELKRRIEIDLREQPSLRELLRKTSVKRSLFICIGLAIFKGFTGIDAITAYMSHIFSKTETPIDPEISTIIFAVVLVAGLFPQAYLVDRAGRKILLIVSQFTMGSCLCALAVCILAADGSTASQYIPIFALCMYTLGYSSGAGPIGWIMMAEIFEDNIRARATSFCTFLIWVMQFLSVKMFVVLEDLLDIYLPIFIFGGVCLIGIAFVLIFVIETKNKSPEEIEEILSK